MGEQLWDCDSQSMEEARSCLGAGRAGCQEMKGRIMSPEVVELDTGGCGLEGVKE